MTSPQKDGLHFVIAFILSIVLMAADHYSQLLDSVRSALLTTLNPIERMATAPVHLYELVTTDFTSLDKLKLENQKLQTEVLLLKARMQQYNNMEQEIHRLEGLLGTTGKMDNQRMQIATVSFFSSNPLSQFITLDKGYLDDVSPRQVIIDEAGVMGQVIRTTPTTSRVLLITDPDHQIPVRIQRTGQRGILTGAGYNALTLDFIPQNSSVQTGDILESSGLGKIFPAGYPVAKVTRINEHKEQPYLDIIAEPIAHLSQAQKVLILSQEPLITRDFSPTNEANHDK